ncbi:MAG TPA: bifunctional nuclease family protein [Polyangiaceae bacterium]|jgi:hypothetical protein
MALTDSRILDRGRGISARSPFGRGVPLRRASLTAFVLLLALAALPLRAQRRADAVEVTVDDMEATPYGVSITLRARRTEDSLHMMIGLTEGEAIARALGHQKTARPMTHDLVMTILDRTGWRVEKVVIREVTNGGNYLADLVLERDGATETIDARPSDAMALAVRSDAKIFVTPEVLEFERQHQEQDQPLDRPSKQDSMHL